LDLIQRALKIFDRLIVAVACNPQKTPLFSVAERLEMIRLATREQPEVEVDHFEGLMISYARRRKVQAVVRGLRAVTDFEYELQLASINRKLCPEIETVFMTPSSEYAYLSSSVVKEVALLGGCIKGFVPEAIESMVLQRLRGGQ